MRPYKPRPLPIEELDWQRLISIAGRANRAVAAFAGFLHGLPSAEVLFSPMTMQEAVLSSRIEGTQAGLEEVLKHEAGDEIPEQSRRLDIQEIVNYRRALRRAEELLETRPFCINSLLELHTILLDSVRGHDKARGRFRRVQNWIGRPGSTIERAYFVPPAPEGIEAHMRDWEAYYHADAEPDPLVQLAVVHAQFELIHPFVDGNGRLGRMIVPLFLYEKGLLSRPCFFVSDYIEAHRSTYYQRLRGLTEPGGWTDWTEFFLTAIAVQGEASVVKARAVLDLYERLRKQVIELTRSRYAVPLLDFCFEHPVFSSSQLFERPEMPSKAAVSGMLGKLKEAGILQTVRAASGRRPQILQLRELIQLSEGRQLPER